MTIPKQFSELENGSLEHQKQLGYLLIGAPRKKGDFPFDRFHPSQFLHNTYDEGAKSSSFDVLGTLAGEKDFLNFEIVL